MGTNDATTIARRPMHLQTLFHGRVRIQVEDKRCKCGEIMPYDGIFDGIVCASRYHYFTPELLDAWMFDVCGSGITFREFFSAWKRKSRAISIEDCIIDEPPL